MDVRFDSGRIEAFSDGVFAVAITLLVLEISVPEASFDDLWNGIVDQWPSYLAYGTSFWTIGGLWIIHHGIFRRLRYADLHLMRMNLFLLFVVAFLPFPTKLMAEAIESANAERVAVLFYGATLLVIGVTVTVIARYAARRDGLLEEGVERSELDAIAARGEPSLTFNALLVALAIIVPQIAALGLFVASLFVVLLPTRAERRLRRA
jgi:uncharacterized membrane protein